MHLSRRFTPTFASMTILAKYLIVGLALCLTAACAQKQDKPQLMSKREPSAAEVILGAEIYRLDRKLQNCLSSGPITITAFPSERSTGGLHDFYSDGDDWWPESNEPDLASSANGDPEENVNFVSHREALIRFSNIVATLTSAYLISGNNQYTDKAAQHLKAWFVDPATRMNPSLRYARTIGGSDNDGIHIMDTIHLTEIARSVKVLSAYKSLKISDERAIREWFGDYLTWLTTHPFGTQARDADDDTTALAWAIQVAAIADLLNNQDQLAQIRNNFKRRFVGKMMAFDGSLQARPYGRQLFVLDSMATVAQIASVEDDDLWRYQAEDGRGMARAVEHMLPYLSKKTLSKNTLSSLPQSAASEDELPVRRSSLAFAALAYTDRSYLDLWQPLQADPKESRVLRKLPVRHPLLWLPNNLPQAVEEVEVATNTATLVQ